MGQYADWLKPASFAINRSDGLEKHASRQAVPGYQWIVRNSDRFGGKPTIRGTRFTVSFILRCLSEGMNYEEIIQDYSEFPRESLPEVLRYASEVTDNPDVAA